MTITEINTLIRFLTNTSSTSLTDAQLLILVNKEYEKVVGEIIKETAGSKWQFGDFNYTAFPTFTVNMTNNVRDYDLRDWGTSDDSTILTIMGVEVKDIDGLWHPLRRITLDHIHNNFLQGEADYQSSGGLSDEYSLRDNMISLYPTPSSTYMTLTAGLKLFFLRTADKFTSAEVTTGTKEPGFPSPYHDILAYGSAYDYALKSGLPNANQLLGERSRKMEELLNFIANRDQDVKYRFKNVRKPYK